MSTEQTTNLMPLHLFPTTIYTVEKPEFLTTVRKVSNEYLEIGKKHHKINDVYPVIMGPNMSNDNRILDFVKFISDSGFSILDQQGYDMNLYGTFVSELWVQDHHKSSGMEQHTHFFGVSLSGFYFLDVPDEACMIQLHDPRPGKVQSTLPEKDYRRTTEASNSIMIKPVAGLAVFSNSWLPHSFTRNSSKKSCKFIHFNVSVAPVQNIPKKCENGPVVI
jgi:uncharacterized protein (TIGR02466 family)